MIKDVMTGTYTYNGEDFNFEFATDLTASEKAAFVASVTNTLVDKDYQMVLRDIIFDYHIITAFTDIDVSFVTESENPIDTIEDILNETSIVDIVKSSIKVGLVDELNKATDANIEYHTGIHKNVLGESLSNLIRTFENKVNEFDMTGAMDMVKKFSGMTEEFTPETIVKAYTDMTKNK